MAKKNQEAEPVVRSLEESDSGFSSQEGEGSPPAPSLPTSDKEKAMASGSDSSDSNLPLILRASKLKLKMPKSKPNLAGPSMKMPAKRPAAVLALQANVVASAEEKDLKKSKTGKGGPAGWEEEDKKPVLFQRLWSDVDEVAILEGMIEFKKQRGVDPMADAEAFLDFIKDSVHINADRRQLVDKVRRLKKRYMNNLLKKKASSSQHEKKIIQLSKIIWGQVEKMEACNLGQGPQFIGKASVSMGLDETVAKWGLQLCSEDSKSEMEEEWRKLHMEQSDLFVRKLDLACRESQMIIAALRSVGN